MFLLISFWQVAASQTGLTRQLKTADTILLISHSMISRSTNSMVDSAGNEVKLPDLLCGDSLNDKVVIERKSLTTKRINDLISILTYPYRPQKTITQSGCFDPHHAIIIKKGSKTSFIDLCFHCMDFEASNDITKLEIRADKWEKLYRFFKDCGFKYAMSLEE